jgi:hypothetical protein
MHRDWRCVSRDTEEPFQVDALLRYCRKEHVYLAGETRGVRYVEDVQQQILKRRLRRWIRILQRVM